MANEWKGIIPEELYEYQGFVYIITNKLKEKSYIGKKFFWNKRTLPPLKGKKNNRIQYVESDWKNYWGSSRELLQDIHTQGKQDFERYILGCFKTRWECAYEELKLQMEQEVVFRDDFYNNIINVRLGKPPKEVLEVYNGGKK